MNGENASHSAEMLGNYEKNLRTFVPEVWKKKCFAFIS
jgi:hypothetical protein